MFVEIIHPDGELKREVWQFEFYGTSFFYLYLNYYALQTRPTTRHKKWREENQWYRLNARKSNIRVLLPNNVIRVLLPTNVLDEAKEQICKAIRNMAAIGGATGS